MSTLVRVVLMSILAGVATFALAQTGTRQSAPAATTGLTEQILDEIDLGPEIEGMQGRRLRIRRIAIEPGGATAIHSHEGRPGTVYVLEGRITDHRNGIATEYGPGLGWPENRATTHWIENRGATRAVEISVDIIKQQ